MIFFVFLIMANITESNEILRGILPASRMRIDMVSFKMPRVGWVPFFVTPSAIPAPIFIPLKNLSANLVRSYPVVFGCLSRAGEDIDSDGQFGQPCYFGHNLPTKLSAQFSDSTCPLGAVVCYISQFSSRNLLAHILDKNRFGSLCQNPDSPSSIPSATERASAFLNINAP